MQAIDENTSDGYHTFKELYHHRMILFAALCKAYRLLAWKSRKHHDGTMFGDDWFIVGIETPEGQYTYHYDEGWELFDVRELEFAPEWDGHKPDDIGRLMSLDLKPDEKMSIYKMLKDITENLND